MGFIYWIDGVPNPWVRAIAILVIGAYYYFYEYDPGAPPKPEWIGPYGQCGDGDGNAPIFQNPG